MLSIRSFFIERNAKDFINTSMLLRHATSFGLYITCTVVFFTVLSMYVWSPSTKLYEYTAGAGIFFNLGSFISEALLFNIFWDLGNKIERETAERSSFVEIKAEDFDEDAELQANMWNSLVRTDCGVLGDDRQFIVTGDSLLASHRASITGKPLPEHVLAISRRSTL